MGRFRERGSIYPRTRCKARRTRHRFSRHGPRTICANCAPSHLGHLRAGAGRTRRGSSPTSSGTQWHLRRLGHFAGSSPGQANPKHLPNLHDYLASRRPPSQSMAVDSAEDQGRLLRRREGPVGDFLNQLLALGLDPGGKAVTRVEIYWVWLLSDDSPGPLRMQSPLIPPDMELPVGIEVA